MDANCSPSDLTNVLTDPQIKLAQALINRDIVEFRDVLKIGANALAKDEQNLSIFEKVLQTPGCGEFVKECLFAGCDPNHLNNFYNKAAINFACDSRDAHNLRELLCSPGINVDHRYSGLTPLNSLAKNLNNENGRNVVECMKLLLRYGASPNIPDHREMTPMHNVINNRKVNDKLKYEIVQMFLSLADIDIDTYREGEIRKILESEYPLMELPACSDQNLVTFYSLLSHIRSGNISAFQQQYNDKMHNNINKDEEVQLLVACIEKGVHDAFDLILSSGVDYNRTVGHNNTAIEIAWIYGNWYALAKLLQEADIEIRSKDHPLINIVTKLNETPSLEFCNYWKCFYALLDSDKIDINAMDFTKSTALHYAVRYHNNKAVKELLKRGACISLENRFRDLPLNGMETSVWEAHLDDCITSSDDKFGDKSYEIIISFKNFMSSQQKSKREWSEVLKPIAFMAKSKEFRYLLQHPVIVSILDLKWHKLSLLFYINFFCYIIFAFAVIAHAVLKFRAKDHEFIKSISLYCYALGTCYLIFREFVQLLISPVKYFQSVSNYLEMLLIIMSLLIFDFFQLDLEKQRNMAVPCILLLAYELFLLVGSLPVSSLSTHMLMLEAVCKSFVKSFLLYSIFIFTFALCFYIKSGNNPAMNGEEAFHNFANPLVTISKTIVMFTGEFDAGSLNLQNNYDNVLFLSFVFFMAIILFNLLNGLAVSDTQAIMNQAELNDIICRTKILYKYEKAFFHQADNFSFLLKRQPFRLLCQILEKLFPDITDLEISILPNENNKILNTKINKKSARLQVRESLKGPLPLMTLPLTENGGDDAGVATHCTRIGKRCVTQAIAILQKKSTSNIENRLDGIQEKLNIILKSLNVTDADEIQVI